MKQCNSSLVKMFLARDTDAQCSFIDVLSKTQTRKQKLKEVLFKAERFFPPLCETQIILKIWRSYLCKMNSLRQGTVRALTDSLNSSSLSLC